MSYSRYYPDGYQSGEAGGTPITPEALNHMEGGIEAALTAADVINALTSSDTKSPLSAAQGKNLKKLLDDNIHPLDRMRTGTEPSMDSYTTAGLYWLNKATVTNTPNGGSGMLIVTTTSTGNAIYQIFVTFNTGNGYVAIRCYTNSQWYPWDERPAPASYVTQEGTSGAWRYRIWSDGKKECWLSTSVQTDITFASGSLFCSGIIPYPYPVTFTGKPTAYVGVRSAYAKPIWGIPSTPSSGASVAKNAYLELVTTTSTASYTGDIYIYACGV